MKYLPLLLLLILVNPSSNLLADNNEKADFVFELLDHVEWPAANNGSEIKICVLGKSPLLESLQKLAESKSTSSRKIIVSQISLEDDITGCHILVIASTELSDLAVALKKVKNQATLTVSDIKGYARYGVMVNITDQDSSEKKEPVIEINKMSAREAGLKISEDLLKKASKTYG